MSTGNQRSGRKHFPTSISLIAGVAAGTIALVFSTLILLIQARGLSNLPSIDYIADVAAAAGVLGALLAFSGTSWGWVRRGREQDGQRRDLLTSAFLSRWSAFEQMLRTHLRDENGGELSLRELLYRASELSAEEGAGDTIFSLLTLRNSLVHKGARPRISVLEVALGALSGLQLDLADRFEVPSVRESSSEHVDTGGPVVVANRGVGASAGAKFELFQDLQGDYYWRLMTDSGEVIATSVAYSSKAGVVDGLKSFRRLFLDAETRESIE